MEEQATGPELREKVGAGRDGGREGGKGRQKEGKRKEGKERRMGWRERGKIDSTAIEEQILAGPCADLATVHF